MKKEKSPAKFRTIFTKARTRDGRRALFREHREVVMYLVFGVMTTVVSFAVYFAAAAVFPDEQSAPGFLRFVYRISAGLGIESATALPVILSWVASVTFAYVTNRIWVFSSRAKGLRVLGEAVSFYAGRGLTLLLDMLIMFLMVDLPGLRGWWYELFARCVVSVFVLVSNYFLSKLIIFRKKT